jgi:hypothetical protein
MQIQIDQVTPLLEAVVHMGEVLRESEGAFEHLTCTETESVLVVLARAGLVRDAVALVIGHAVGYVDGDDDGDAHGLLKRVYEAGYPEAADLMATQYVTRLL